MTPRSSYQTAPLREYREDLQHRAIALFGLVKDRIGPSRVREHKGSFSILQEPGLPTAAKILIYEAGKGSMSGPDLSLADGIYIWVRVHGGATGRTLSVAPHRDERFAYFRLLDGQDLEEIAEFLSAVADRRT